MHAGGRLVGCFALAQPENPDSRAVQLLQGVRAALKSLDVKELDTPVN